MIQLVRQREFVIVLAAVASLVTLLVACSEPGDVSNPPTEDTNDLVCFEPDLTLAAEPADLEDVRDLADRLDLRLPELPQNLGVSVVDAAVLDGGNSEGLLVNLRGETRASPVVALRITPQPDCFQSTSNPIAKIRGTHVFTLETDIFNVYSTWFETGSVFVELEISWSKESAPPVDERLAYVSAWIGAVGRR